MAVLKLLKALPEMLLRLPGWNKPLANIVAHQGRD
jgi:hypothetical protein